MSRNRNNSRMTTAFSYAESGRYSTSLRYPSNPAEVPSDEGDLSSGEEIANEQDLARRWAVKREQKLRREIVKFQRWWTTVLELRRRARRKREPPNDGMNTYERIMYRRQNMQDMYNHTPVNEYNDSGYDDHPSPYGYARRASNDYARHDMQYREGNDVTPAVHPQAQVTERNVYAGDQYNEPAVVVVARNNSDENQFEESKYHSPSPPPYHRQDSPPQNPKPHSPQTPPPRAATNQIETEEESDAEEDDMVLLNEKGEPLFNVIMADVAEGEAVVVENATKAKLEEEKNEAESKRSRKEEKKKSKKLKLKKNKKDRHNSDEEQSDNGKEKKKKHKKKKKKKDKRIDDSDNDELFSKQKIDDSKPRREATVLRPESVFS